MAAATPAAIQAARFGAPRARGSSAASCRELGCFAAEAFCAFCLGGVLLRLRAKVFPFGWGGAACHAPVSRRQSPSWRLWRDRPRRLFEIGQRGSALTALNFHERTGLNPRFAYVQKRPAIGLPTVRAAEALNMGNLLGFWAISPKSATLWQAKMGTEPLYFRERVWFKRAGSPSSSG